MGNKAVKAQQQHYEEHFGRSSTFEKMSRAMNSSITSMMNATKSKNKVAAEKLVNDNTKGGMGMAYENAKKDMVENLAKRMDILDMLQKMPSEINGKLPELRRLQDQIEKLYTGFVKSTLPSKKWYKTGPSDIESKVDTTTPSSFGRRRRSHVKRRAVKFGSNCSSNNNSFGRKRRSSKRRVSFGKKRHSSKRRASFGKKRRSSKRRHH